MCANSQPEAGTWCETNVWGLLPGCLTSPTPSCAVTWGFTVPHIPSPLALSPTQRPRPSTEALAQLKGPCSRGLDSIPFSRDSPHRQARVWLVDKLPPLCSFPSSGWKGRGARFKCGFPISEPRDHGPLAQHSCAVATVMPGGNENKISGM